MSGALEKFSSQMDGRILARLREYARQSNQPISRILNEAVAAHLDRVRIRPAVRAAVDEVLEEHRNLLSRLAK